MTTVDLPDLPPIVARLVRGGVYSIYAVRGTPAEPYVLVTSAGDLHRLSASGRITTAVAGARLADFAVESELNIGGSAPSESVIQINNL